MLLSNQQKLGLENLNDEDRVNLLKSIFADDIEEFGKFFFKNHLRLETPQLHRDIYALYQDTNLKRIAIAAPRGHAKSTITDLVFLAWNIIYKKVHFVLLVSDTYSQAAMFLDSLKAEFESNELLRLFYGTMTSKSWAEGEVVTNNIMIKAVGAGMKVRGLKYRAYRPDLIIIDDLENDEMVESKERREKLERWFNGALVPSLDIQTGRIVMIGTILHYASLLSKMLDDTGYLEFEKRRYKAITNGLALWPEHLSLQDLERIKNDYISKGQGFLFYQEYQNDPISEENRKFKLEKFRYYEDKEIASKDLRTYITIDRAYSLEKTADSTGIIVRSVDRDNNWYIRMAERYKGTEQELIDKIFDLHKYWQPDTIAIEQKAYTYTLKPTMDEQMRKRNTFFKIEELKDLGRNKNVRIEGLIPRFESGSIYMKKEMYDLIDELCTFPKGRHDDLIDSLSYQLELGIGIVYRNVVKQHFPTGLARRLRPNLNNI